MLKTHKQNLTKKEIGLNINIKIGLSKKYSEKITDDFIEIEADLKVGKRFINETYSSLVLYSKKKAVALKLKSF